MRNLHEIVFASSDKSVSKKVRQQLKNGQLREIAPRVYTTNLSDDAGKIVLRNWFYILSHLFPDAILSHRSALDGRPINGHIFLSYSSTRNVQLPGLIVHLLKGAGKNIGTTHFFEKLHRSSEPRAFLENMQSTRSTAEFSKKLTVEALEKKLETIIRTRGEKELNKIRDEARYLSDFLNMPKEFERLNNLISALLSTHSSKILNTEVARARALGEPFDPERDALFNILYDYLADKEFKHQTDINIADSNYNNFAFFESYFSNFIEGTEFTINEAKEIIATETPMPARDEDSHDILGTYQVVSNRKEMSITPESADHFLELLRTRHETMLRARTGKRPGQFKDRNNRAGETEFVNWELVTGTLKKGYQWYSLLNDPLAKAAFMMFLVAEVHPFLDGNGRIARVMMNAELTAKRMSKILIPTVYRIDYLDAIRKLTRRRDPETYVRMLNRAYEFSATVHGEDLDAMERYLRSCNAFEQGDEQILRFKK